VVATGDLTNFSLHTVFKGFYQIYFLNDGKILIFTSQYVHLNFINHVKRFLNKFIEHFFFVNVKTPMFFFVKCTAI